MQGLTSIARIALPALLLALAISASAPASAGRAAPRCDAHWNGYQPLNRVACYKGCVGHRVRAYCNSWCDRHCRR